MEPALNRALDRIYRLHGIGPGIRVWVTVNTNLHIFQWQPFTLIRVTYKYR